MRIVLRPMIYAIVLTCVGAFAACDSNNVEETVWDEQTDALQKAREVEDKLMNRADQLSKDLGIEDDEADKEDDAKPPRG